VGVAKSMVLEEDVSSKLHKRLMGWGNEREDESGGKGRVFYQPCCDEACMELVHVFCSCAFRECGNGWSPWLVWRGTKTNNHQWLKLSDILVIKGVF